MRFKEVDTERFNLVVLIPELVSETYLAWFSDKESSTYIEYAKKQTSLEELKAYAKEKLESENALMFGIFSKETSRHLGNIKFEPIDLGSGIAVLGVLIGDHEWRGKGLFSEISIALESELKASGVNSIYLGVEKENKAAIRAYEKTGYTNDDDNYLNVNRDKSFCMVKRLV